jgi:hypothetical protein
LPAAGRGAGLRGGEPGRWRRERGGTRRGCKRGELRRKAAPLRGTCGGCDVRPAQARGCGAARRGVARAGEHAGGGESHGEEKRHHRAGYRRPDSRAPLRPARKEREGSGVAHSWTGAPPQGEEACSQRALRAEKDQSCRGNMPHHIPLLPQSKSRANTRRTSFVLATAPASTASTPRDVSRTAATATLPSTGAALPPHSDHDIVDAASRTGLGV